MEFLKIWEILLRRKWIILSVFSVFVVTTYIGVHLVTPTYEAKAKLLIEKSETLSSLMSSLGLTSQGGGMTSSEDDDYETEIALSKIRPLLEELISSLNLKNRKGEVIKPEKLIDWSLYNLISPQPYVDVDQYEDAEMLEISSTSSSPEEASKIANKLAELYINDTLGRMRAEYKVARMFIEERIKEVKADYDKSLADTRDFKIKERTVDLSLETQNMVNKIATLTTSYEDYEKTIIELDKKLAETKNQLDNVEQYRKDSEEFSQSDQIKSLKNKLNELLIKISETSMDFTKEHPDYKQLEKEIDTVKELIQGEADVVFNSERRTINPVYDELLKSLVVDSINRMTAVAKRDLLKRYINRYSKEMLKLPEKVVDGSKLELALSVNKETYQKLLEYMTQVSIAETVTLSSIKLVEAANVPDEKNFPKKGLMYALGICLGLFWGLALAFFIEYIDNTIKSPDDIKHIQSLTNLGAIPDSKQLQQAGTILGMDPTTPIVEAYRTVRNSIRYASLDRPAKSIAVTSSTENEGKSTVSANLAAIMNMEGKRVILVDMDLRRPTVHKLFKFPNSVGVTNVLAEGYSLEDAIKKTNIKGLDLLLSGPVPPDPSRLVESEGIKQVLSTLKEKYDAVIIDTPPAIAVNDAFIVGGYAEGLVFVVESGRAAFSTVEHVRDMMGKAGVNLIGVVLNKFKAHASGYYHYYYYNRYYKK